MATRFLERRGGRIAYDDTGGDGPLVVAVPGMGDLRQVYRFLMPQLAAAGHRVVTVDPRGQGESSPAWDDYATPAIGDDVVALVRHLDAGPARVLGGSMAAAAGVWAAAEAPADIAALVLLGPFVRDVPMTAVQRLAVWALLSLPGGPANWTRRYYRTLYPSAPPADLPSHLAALEANLAEPGRFAALRAMVRASKAPVEARLGEVTAPVLVVMGTKDPDFTDPAAEALLAGDRLRARVLLVDGAGHYPQAEFPQVVGPEVVAFLHASAGATPDRR